uniref:LIM zinc-binding domain-containing protein n=1 Tax=Panagrolaimus davidi TaxID=227884 RepID=A0A914P176_9BILA
MPRKSNNILFQYAPKCEDCNVCEEIIPSGDLEVIYGDHIHFNCFFGFYDVLCDKRHLLIAAEEYMDEKLKPKTSVSLEDIDFPGGFNLKISDNDVTKIREHLSLVDGRFNTFVYLNK